MLPAASEIVGLHDAVFAPSGAAAAPSGALWDAIAANHRHKIHGVVHRVSGTGETVFIEPASIANLSAERITLKAEEDREVKRILRRLSQEVGRVAKPLTYALDVIARLDFITAKAKFSRDYRMSEPELNTDGRLWLRNARHPLLEHLFREPGTGSREPGTKWRQPARD